MEKRLTQSKEFFDAVLDPQEQPYFVSDQATLYDIYVGEKEELIERCREHYGVVLELKHFHLPVWQVLDHVQVHRQR